MITMRIATLNVQNLRLLHDLPAKHLRGAWDSDDPETAVFDVIDRRLTAQLMAEVNADVFVLQEVFDLETLNFFHDRFLVPAGMKPYPHRICIPGNDGRGLDVAVLSRIAPEGVKSHADVTPRDLNLPSMEGVKPDVPVFRRDCLLVKITGLNIFACHFKSPYPNPELSWITRRCEALATRKIVEQNCANLDDDLWLIAGDLNEGSETRDPDKSAISPITGGFSVNLLDRLPASNRWTYFDPHSGFHHCPDALLASLALARRWPEAVPTVVRKGLGLEATGRMAEHFPGVGQHRPHASDHAAVYVDLPGI